MVCVEGLCAPTKIISHHPSRCGFSFLISSRPPLLPSSSLPLLLFPPPPFSFSRHLNASCHLNLISCHLISSHVILSYLYVISCHLNLISCHLNLISSHTYAKPYILLSILRANLSSNSANPDLSAARTYGKPMQNHTFCSPY